MKYVAFLRGIGPTNPNMHPAKLKNFFEGLSFKNVMTVISSGNVIFESNSKNSSLLEKKIETALPLKLGFNSKTIIRSEEELKRLVKKDPFKGKKHGRESYLIVTFLKKKPYEIYNVINTNTSKTPDFMLKLEREYGKEITTRTWKTIERIVKKINL
jgi:uncharacterized protein (DUF1697 family)